MCEYSLNTVPNRLAVEGEHLITHRFPTCSIGLASVTEMEAAARTQPKSETPRSLWSAVKNWLNPPSFQKNVTAVCIPPGARLRVSQLSKHIREELYLGQVEEVTFFELSATAYQYRDAIRFWNGRSMLLQHLNEGIRFEVLSLASSEPEVTAPVAAEPDRDAAWAYSRHQDSGLETKLGSWH